MKRHIPSLFAAALLVVSNMPVFARERPAPPESRYAYSFTVDEKSLPKRVSVRTVVDGKNSRHFIKNTGETPLVIGEIYSNDKLVSGTKLVGGKVYGWFPSGVPMEGKTHLKGWQAPFGDILETILTLPREPAKIIEGRKPGLGKEIPKPEEASIKVSYAGKPYEIKIKIVYRLNEAYGK
ncbi:MAG: hypothetical protein IAF94_13020 [Pirellulaceae bacterium]|nr:hypothetical protein [Pirellulaceae bacterium]